jgi:hypothetical protein
MKALTRSRTSNVDASHISSDNAYCLHQIMTSTILITTIERDFGDTFQDVVDNLTGNQGKGCNTHHNNSRHA